MCMSLSMDSLTEPTECQGQRDHYVTGRFWRLWSLTGELVDGFTVSMTLSTFKGNLKKALALLASCFMTGQCWCGLKMEGFTYLIISLHYPFLTHLSLSGLWWQAKWPTHCLEWSQRLVSLLGHLIVASLLLDLALHSFSFSMLHNTNVFSYLLLKKKRGVKCKAVKEVLTQPTEQISVTLLLVQSRFNRPWGQKDKRIIY